MSGWLRRLSVIAIVPVLLALGAPLAHAEDELDVSVGGGGEITMTAKGDWHINVDFPWKVYLAGSKVEQAKFTLTEKTAVVRGTPTGTITIRGGVCGEGRCRAFSREIQNR